MTIRQLAAHILRSSIRRASPRAREWGQAMLREIDFVPGDWAALFWAIESSVALFLREHESPMTQAEIWPRTQMLIKTVRRRTLGGYAACLTVSVWLAHDFFVFPKVSRIGAVITAGSCLLMAYQLYRRRGGALPPGPTPPAFTKFYRAELARQRDFHRGSWLWSRVVLLFLGCELLAFGLAMAHRGQRQHWIAMAFFLLILIAAVPGNLRRSRKYQRQIDDLDTLDKDSLTDQN